MQYTTDANEHVCVLIRVSYVCTEEEACAIETPRDFEQRRARTSFCSGFRRFYDILEISEECRNEKNETGVKCNESEEFSK